MSRKVVVVDYGIGNLLSVTRALTKIEADAALSNSPDEVANADRLILPGVGAFGDGMAGLAAAGLTDAVKRYAERDRPFLGICLGMQMMLNASMEFGSHAGLGLIAGTVVPVPTTASNDKPHKIPHIGWNRLNPANGGWSGTILEGLSDDRDTYFVHSFMADPTDPAHRLADCDYNGRRVSAVIRRDHLYGCQFHPEKSGPVGLRILQSFIAL
jgi:imidazole glycerol-phosphate synthase subunit HisH